MHCRRSTASFRKKLFGHEQQEGYEDNIITQDMSIDYVRIHPLSSFKRYWDLAIVVMVAYTVVALPVRCAFSWDYYHALDAGHNLFHQLAVRCHAITTAHARRCFPIVYPVCHSYTDAGDLPCTQCLLPGDLRLLNSKLLIGLMPS